MLSPGQALNPPSAVAMVYRGIKLTHLPRGTAASSRRADDANRDTLYANSRPEIRWRNGLSDSEQISAATIGGQLDRRCGLTTATSADVGTNDYLRDTLVGQLTTMRSGLPYETDGPPLRSVRRCNGEPGHHRPGRFSVDRFVRLAIRSKRPVSVAEDMNAVDQRRAVRIFVDRPNYDGHSRDG
jgi:hypothetical protein